MLSPTQIKELCSQFGLKPSKQYGQNYLVQDSPIKKMVEAAQISKKDTVIEIGPGFGVLSFALAEKAKQVFAFEIEKKLKPYWYEKEKEYKNLKIIWGNALNKLSIISDRLLDYKVVANLPYQITSNVLRKLLEAEQKPKSITVMVQKEVAERICAKPGDMSLLSVSVQFFGKPRIITKVSKGNFWPQPKVDSAVLHIDVSEQRTVDSEQFFKVARAGFSNKRKQLWRNLAEGLKIDKEEIKTVLKDKIGNEKARAQELSVEDWTSVTEVLASSH